MCCDGLNGVRRILYLVVLEHTDQSANYEVQWDKKHAGSHEVRADSFCGSQQNIRQNDDRPSSGLVIVYSPCIDAEQPSVEARSKSTLANLSAAVCKGLTGLLGFITSFPLEGAVDWIFRFVWLGVPAIPTVPRTVILLI
jgi:hypothetical protein